MAYPTSFLRMVVSGTLYGNETFSWSLSLRPNFPSNPAPTVVPPDLITALSTFHNSASSQIGAAATMTLVKLNEIGTDGRYVSSTDTVQHEFDPGIAGTGASDMPPQSALVVTLRTAQRRGLANTGRFYLPFLSAGVGADGRVLAGGALGIAANVTTLLNSIKTALGDEWLPAVVSDIGAGAMNTITHVEVGRVVDTVRSRRSSLDEDRQVGAPLAP